MSFRKRAFEILEVSSKGDRISYLVDALLVLLILLNLAAIILESVPAYRLRWETTFHAFELFSVAVFTVEYLMRLWCSAEHPRLAGQGPIQARLRHMFSMMAIIDLMAILPFFLGMFFTLDLRFMRVLRLLRIFKLTRYFSAVNVVLEVLHEEARAFGAAFFVLMVIMVLASSGIYIFEHEAQPEAFGSIPAAMWWAVATLTTVGYGDVTPVTVGGKIFGACITIVGIGMVALPAGILASAFSDHLHERKSAFGEKVDQALKDGVITQFEEKQLEDIRKELDLTPEEATFILDQARKHYQAHHPHCPHCGKPVKVYEDGGTGP